MTVAQAYRSLRLLNVPAFKAIKGAKLLAKLPNANEGDVAWLADQLRNWNRCQLKYLSVF